MTDQDTRDDSLPDESLPPSVARAIATQRPLPPPAPDTVDRVMSGVRQARARRRHRRLVIAPLGLLAASASALLLLRSPRSDDMAPAGETHRVEFTVNQPAAEGLSVVGDFNAWDVQATPMTRDEGSDRWVATVQLPAGRYLYAFVADGSRWLPDPSAPLAAPDDFSRRNSVLLVGAAHRASQ